VEAGFERASPAIPSLSSALHYSHLLGFVSHYETMPILTNVSHAKGRKIAFALVASLWVLNMVAEKVQRGFFDIYAIDSSDTSMTLYRDKVQLSFRLQPYTSFENRFGSFHTCDKTRAALAEPLQPVLNFTTQIDTKLKILCFGDSATLQIAEVLQELAGCTLDKSSVLHYTAGKHQGIAEPPPFSIFLMDAMLR